MLDTENGGSPPSLPMPNGWYFGPRNPAPASPLRRHLDEVRQVGPSVPWYLATIAPISGKRTFADGR